eukprot:TRINITY_DN5358_c0_g1_i1.p1 TRINITY_DN5358_c0_g1~~TRINITY_DN5358_c0_g1_i1.p1  ORF type:complete len:137 (-),score=11.41 TRINITY_DN5358_c0_g1_i1:6-416(-)
MIRRPPRSTLSSSSAASDVYKRQVRGPCREENAKGDFRDQEVPRNRTPQGRGEHAHRELVVALATIGLAYHKRCAFPFAAAFSCDCDLLQTLSLIHISEPTRLLSISYAVFCLKKKNNKKEIIPYKMSTHKIHNTI